MSIETIIVAIARLVTVLNTYYAFWLSLVMLSRDPTPFRYELPIKHAL
jgi:hypothetical protein